jgi:hypothetical protein
MPDPSMPGGQQQPADANPPQLPDPHANDARQWAGDPYDEGDEPQPDDPAVTAKFTDPSGEEAWLQRAQDGTLTGWVRDATGQVYRYNDADAWAIDVDDAGMTASGGDSTPDMPSDPPTAPSTTAPQTPDGEKPPATEQ